MVRIATTVTSMLRARGRVRQKTQTPAHASRVKIGGISEHSLFHMATYTRPGVRRRQLHRHHLAYERWRHLLRPHLRDEHGVPRWEPERRSQPPSS